MFDCRLTYGAPYLPKEYLGSGFFRAHIYAQIEPGGKLYMMLPEDEAPIDAATYPQPEGYPVTPTVSGNCDWQVGGDPSSGEDGGYEEPGREASDASVP